MGTWDVKPWDNDAASDWFYEFFEKTKIAQYVEETLGLDAEEDNFNEIRAAAYVVIALGRTYIWTLDLDKHIALAASRLQEIVDQGYLDEDPESVAEVKKEIMILKSRMPQQQ